MHTTRFEICSDHITHYKIAPCDSQGSRLLTLCL